MSDHTTFRDPSHTIDLEALDTGSSLGRRARSASFYLMPVFALILLVLVWHFAIVIFEIRPFLLPRPWGVFTRVFSERDRLLEHAWPTIQEILGGFLLSVVIGIPLAIAMVSSTYVDRAVSPLLVASQTVPKIAIAPVLLVWFGLGLTPKVFIAFLIAFFPVVISTAVGLRSVPGELIDLATSMGAGRFQLFRRIRFPYALPTIFGGLKVAITLAAIGAIVGEFVGADQGLGYLIMVANGRLDTELMFAVVIVLVAIGVALYWVIELLERILVKSRPDQSASDVTIAALG
jgi:NitT/TauT family transport system permease protein